jgi:predicted TIM-barrel fold metal-dependent hydrolase
LTKTKKMEIIDCHVNLGWEASNIRKNLIPSQQSTEKVLQKMDQYGISKAVVLPFPCPGAQFNKNFAWYDTENQYLISASKISDKLIPFPGVNPGQKQSVDNINTMAVGYGVKGVKFSHQNLIQFPIDKLINHPLMKIIQDNNLVFMIHTGTGKEPGSDVYHTTLDYALLVAKFHPDVNFMFCHLGRLHKDLFEALKMPNVYMDTSALSLAQFSPAFVAKNHCELLRLSRPKEIIETLVTQGFEDKIIFGSDEPYTQYNNELNYVINANISEIAKRKIFSANLSKLLNL